MKRLVFCLILCTLLITPLLAYADVLIEPVEPENNFYKQHQDQIVYLGRSFIANGTGDEVSVKKAPGSLSNVGKLKTGENVYVDYSCLYNGEYWGLIISYNGKTGWVKMEQMLVLYDYIAFEEEHIDDLYYYNGDYAEIKESHAAIAWPWPGADAPLWTVEDLDVENFRVPYAYQDDEGREWGFVPYLYGSRNIWVCLSEPLNRDIPVFNPTPAPLAWESETAHNDIGKSGNPTLVIIIILVVILVISTIILLKVFWKPNKAGRKQ